MIATTSVNTCVFVSSLLEMILVRNNTYVNNTYLLLFEIIATTSILRSLCWRCSLLLPLEMILTSWIVLLVVEDDLNYFFPRLGDFLRSIVWVPSDYSHRPSPITDDRPWDPHPAAAKSEIRSNEISWSNSWDPPSALCSNEISLNNPILVHRLDPVFVHRRRDLGLTM